MNTNESEEKGYTQDYILRGCRHVLLDSYRFIGEQVTGSDSLPGTFHSTTNRGAPSPNRNTSRRAQLNVHQPLGAGDLQRI